MPSENIIAMTDTFHLTFSLIFYLLRFYFTFLPIRLRICLFLLTLLLYISPLLAFSFFFLSASLFPLLLSLNLIRRIFSYILPHVLLSYCLIHPFFSLSLSYSLLFLLFLLIVACRPVASQRPRNNKLYNSRCYVMAATMG
jgi:hypothetical protein